jgi:hypothetical protein
MAHTPLKKAISGTVLFLALLVPRAARAEPAGDGSFFYAVGEPAIGYAFGRARYDGPVFSGTTSTASYEAKFHGLSAAITLGAGYKLSRTFASGGRGLAGLGVEPSWESRIPGSGLTSYAVFGAEAFGKWLPSGVAGPSLEVALGYAQLRFASESDLVLLPGGIQDTEVFHVLHGLVAGAAIGWPFEHSSWTIEPRLGVRYFNAASDHGASSAWMPSLSISLQLGGA